MYEKSTLATVDESLPSRATANCCEISQKRFHIAANRTYTARLVGLERAVMGHGAFVPL